MSWKEISVVNILAQRIHYHCGLEASFLESHRSENTTPCHLLTYRVNHWGLSKEVWWSRLLCRGWQALGRQLWRLKFPFLSGRIYVGSLWRRRQTEQIDCTCRSTVWMRWTSLGVIFNSTKQGKTEDYKTVFVPGEWRDMHSQIFLLSPDTLGALIDWLPFILWESSPGWPPTQWRTEVDFGLPWFPCPCILDAAITGMPLSLLHVVHAQQALCQLSYSCRPSGSFKLCLDPFLQNMKVPGSLCLAIPVKQNAAKVMSMWLPWLGHKRVAFCRILSQVIFSGLLQREEDPSSEGGCLGTVIWSWNFSWWINRLQMERFRVWGYMCVCQLWG